MRTAQQRRDEVSLAVRRIVVRESRLSMDAAGLTEDEPLNGDLLRINSLGFLGMLVRLEDGAEVLVHPPELDTPVTALAWNADGTQLAFACEERIAGVVDLA